ncbi:MAG TPA: TIGR03118 family protein [Nevskiaceae bacterium]|nr:TIGR03118 family protein [Nevskiaceae bacterium]
MRAQRFLIGALLAGATAIVIVACGGSGDDGFTGGMQSGYTVGKLVADTPNGKYAGENTPAGHVDASLKNPWGIAFNPAGFVWVANNHTDTSTLYDGNGNKQSLEVALPEEFEPTGIVYNGSGAFAGAIFIFAGESGAIAAWSTGTTAQTKFTASDGAVYTGLAIAGTQLYAADFHNGKVDVIDTNFAKVASTGFVDPNLPAHYAPFGIQAIGNRIVVAYAERDEGTGDESPGAGKGIVDSFNTSGGDLVRVIGTGGALNAPWGIALAPASFGAFSSDLLVGNFGDGKINAFSPTTGALIGTLKDAGGTDIALEGLWGIAFGNGINNQPSNALFFAAGLNDEENGLYGKITCNGC